MRKIATYLMAILLPLSSLFATELDSDKFLDAVAQYAEGHYSSALVLLTELLETSPDDDAVNYYMGLCELPLNKVRCISKRPHLLTAPTNGTPTLW